MALFLMVSTLTPSDAFPLLPANVQHSPIQCSLQPSSRTSKKLVDRPVCVKNPEAHARTFHTAKTRMLWDSFDSNLIFCFQKSGPWCKAPWPSQLCELAHWAYHPKWSEQKKTKQMFVEGCKLAHFDTQLAQDPQVSPTLALHRSFFFPNSCSTKGHGSPNAPFASDGGQFWRQGFRAKNSCPTLDAS